MRPVPDHPAALLGRMLVIGDLHLGIELALRRNGLSLPPQTDKLRKSVLELIDSTEAEELLVLGDVKHSLGPEGAEEVHRFFRRFPVPYSIVPGNHDGLLDEILPAVKLHPASGVKVKDTCFLHGHALPSKDLLDSDEFVISHSHPAISFVDSVGAKTKVSCWLRTTIDFGEGQAKLTVLPAFNPLLGGGPLNESEPLGPMLKRADLGRAKIYLLDGSFVGELSDLK